MDDSVGQVIVLVAAFVPLIITGLITHFACDNLLLFMVLSLYYLMVPVFYDLFIYNLRWEFKYGPLLARWHSQLAISTIFGLASILIGSLCWMIPYMVGVDSLIVEKYCFMYCDRAPIGILYYFLSIIFFVLIMPICEEFFYRALVLVHGNGIGGQLASIVGFALQKTVFFMAVYPEMLWSLLGLFIIFAVMAAILNGIFMSKNQGIFCAIFFSIGFSIATVVRILILSQGYYAFKMPKLFLLNDPDTLWFKSLFMN